MATQIVVPILGEAISEATLLNWAKKVGETVRRGDELAELETAKATMPLESPTNGVLLQIVVEPGTLVVPGQLLAVVGRPGETLEQPAQPAQPAAAEAASASASEPAAQGFQSDEAGSAARVSPAARRMALTLGVDLAKVQPARPGARLTTEDVQRYADSLKSESGPAAAPAAPPYRAIPVNTVRKVLAQRMVESAREIPQFSVSLDVDAGNLLKKHAELKSQGVQASLSVLLIQLVSKALLSHPLLNARFAGEEVHVYETVNLAVAVDAPHGLSAPVIHAAEKLGLREIAARLDEISTAARQERLSLPQISGATFTLSNLGMLGVTQFTPLVNPPQSAILGLGAARPALLPTPEGGLRPVTLLSLTVSADHRVTDGAEVARFLNTLRGNIENPEFRLL